MAQVNARQTLDRGVPGSSLSGASSVVSLSKSLIHRSVSKYSLRWKDFLYWAKKKKKKKRKKKVTYILTKF